MKHTVEITTPIPSAERIAERLGISKARLRVLRNIVDDQLRKTRGNKHPALRHRNSSTIKAVKK